MPNPSSYAKKNETVKNPAGIDIGAIAERLNPPIPPVAGPAWRGPGARLGDAPTPAVAKFNPPIPGPGGPAIYKPGHRLGQVEDANPAARLHPKMKG